VTRQGLPEHMASHIKDLASRLASLEALVLSSHSTSSGPVSHSASNAKNAALPAISPPPKRVASAPSATASPYSTFMSQDIDVEDKKKANAPVPTASPFIPPSSPSPHFAAPSPYSGMLSRDVDVDNTKGVLDGDSKPPYRIWSAAEFAVSSASSAQSAQSDTPASSQPTDAYRLLENGDVGTPGLFKSASNEEQKNALPFGNPSAIRAVSEPCSSETSTAIESLSSYHRGVNRTRAVALLNSNPHVYLFRDSSDDATRKQLPPGSSLFVMSFFLDVPKHVQVIRHPDGTLSQKASSRRFKSVKAIVRALIGPDVKPV